MGALSVAFAFFAQLAGECQSFTGALCAHGSETTGVLACRLAPEDMTLLPICCCLLPSPPPALCRCLLGAGASWGP